MSQASSRPPALFQEMAEHFRNLPAGTLVREVWHTHSKKQLGTFIRRTDFADRAREEVGYLIPQVYSEHLRTSDYRIRWIPIEDTPTSIDAFCRVFDRFNVYTTLNRYPMAYANARLELMAAEYWLWLAEQNQHSRKKAAQIPELREKVSEAEAAVPRACHVDLAFDFDSGTGGTLRDLIPRVIRLLEFCELYAVPHQLFFSGGRGFHVVIPYSAMAQSLAEDNHLVNRRVAELIQEETGDLALDWAIYSNRRQFRLPNTRHQKSGLFKVALQRSDLELGEPRILELARTAVPVRVPLENCCEYLAQLHALAATEVRSTRQHAVTPQRTPSLPAARQSRPRLVKVAKGESSHCVVTSLEELTHPPCMLEAIRVGVPDPTLANRNQVTVLLACYLKAIGRKAEEAMEFLVRHALEVLQGFSHSTGSEIENSTRTAVTTVFRSERYQFNCRIARRMGFECNDTCELHSQTRETATSRRLHKVAPGRTQPQESGRQGPVFTDVDLLRADMRQVTAKYIDASRRVGGGPPVTPLLVKSPAGTGKTTVIFNLLDELGLRALWVATRLDLFDNIPSDIKSRWRRIEGRHAEVSLPDGKVLLANCAYPEVAHRLRERRINVNDRLCRECDCRVGCDYFAQFEDEARSFFVQQPMYLHKVKDYAAQFDVVVFDEDILGQFIEEVRIREQDVRQMIGLLRQLREDLECIENQREAGRLTPLICLLEGLVALLAEPPILQPISGSVLHQRLAEAYERIFEGTGAEGIPLRLNEAVEAIPTSLDNVVDDLHFDPLDSSKPLPLQFLNVLLPVLRFELLERDPATNLSRLHLRGVRVAAKEGDEKGKRRFANVLEVVLKADAPPLPTPTILLDATGKPEIYERLFGVRPDVYSPTMKLENQVTQVYSTSGSYATMRRALFLTHLLELLERLLRREPRTLVICKQGLERQVRPHLPPEAGLTHYYGNRGSNAFRDFKHVVIFGMPGMTPDSVLRYAGALYHEDNFVSDTEYVVRRYQGHEVGVQVLVYKEPLIQAIAETAREDEVLQSIHRIRPGLDPSKGILLVTNLVVPELPITRLVSVREILDRGPPAGTNARRSYLEALTRHQMDVLGFAIPARTLWPLVGPEDGRFKLLCDALAKLEAVLPVPPEQRYTRSRFYEAKDEVRAVCNLERFDVPVVSASGRVAVEVWGRSRGCLDAARCFLRDHPLELSDVAEGQSQENAQEEGGRVPDETL